MGLLISNGKLARKHDLRQNCLGDFCPRLVVSRHGSDCFNPMDEEQRVTKPFGLEWHFCFVESLELVRKAPCQVQQRRGPLCSTES